MIAEVDTKQTAGDFSPAVYLLTTDHYFVIFSPIDFACVNSSR
jgi:hypothetical protein